MADDRWRPNEDQAISSDGRALDRLFGIVGSRASKGRAECDVEAGDGEAAPTTFALTTAVDILLVRAAATTVGPPQEMNGTAELNVTYLRSPTGIAHVDCEVTGRSPTMRLVDFTVRDAEGELARGRSTYAVSTRRSR